MMVSLFDPIAIGGVGLRNRLVMAPMARRFAQDGVPRDAYVDYFARRAAGGVGLILTDATGVSHPTAARTPAYPRMEPGPAESVWRRIVEAVHAEGARFMPQLYHAGATRKRGDPPNPHLDPFTPSGLSLPLNGKREGGFETVGLAAEEAEIRDVIAAFGKSAALARQLGCDGVEIHGAHGYAIDQFFWSDMNRRNDAWGGDIARRGRLAVEIVRECRRRTCPEFLLSFRISQWKQQDFAARLANDPAELAQIVVPLAEAGVDLFHCSTRRFWEPEFSGSELNLAGWVKQLTGKPTITVGSVGLEIDFVSSDGRSPDGSTGHVNVTGIERLQEMFDRGMFDLVAIGRALISNPDWVLKMQRGEEAQPYDKTMLDQLY